MFEPAVLRSCVKKCVCCVCVRCLTCESFARFRCAKRSSVCNVPCSFRVVIYVFQLLLFLRRWRRCIDKFGRSCCQHVDVCCLFFFLLSYVLFFGRIKSILVFPQPWGEKCGTCEKIHTHYYCRRSLFAFKKEIRKHVRQECERIQKERVRSSHESNATETQHRRVVCK